MLNFIKKRFYIASLKSDGFPFFKACEELSKIDNDDARKILSDSFIYSENESIEKKKALFDAVTKSDKKVLGFLHRDMIDANGKVRSHVMTAIGIISSQESVPFLLNILNEHDDPSLTFAASKICREKALDKIVKIIFNVNSHNRLFALNALFENNITISKEHLVNLLKDSDLLLRKKAAEIIDKNSIALGNNDKPHFLSALEKWDEILKLGDNAINALTMLLKDNSITVRIKVLETLFKINSLSTNKLIAKAISDYEPQVRLTAINCYWQSKYTIDFLPIINALSDEDNNVRLAAEEALINLGERSLDVIINTLSSAIESGLNLIYLTNLQNILVKTGSPAIPFLEKLAKGKNGKLALVATEILSEIESDSQKELMLSLLKSDIAEVRSVAIETLGAFREPTIFEEISSLINDNNSLVRKNVYDSLVLIDISKAENLYKSIMSQGNLPEDDRVYIGNILKEIAKVN